MMSMRISGRLARLKKGERVKNKRRRDHKKREGKKRQGKKGTEGGTGRFNWNSYLSSVSVSGLLGSRYRSRYEGRYGLKGMDYVM